VESASEVTWVAEPAPGAPLDCTIESARGLLAAFEIASCPACTLLSYGGVDLALDLGIAGGELGLCSPAPRSYWPSAPRGSRLRAMGCTP
jgi:citrate lyase beta subunit